MLAVLLSCLAFLFTPSVTNAFPTNPNATSTTLYQQEAPSTSQYEDALLRSSQKYNSTQDFIHVKKALSMFIQSLEEDMSSISFARELSQKFLDDLLQEPEMFQVLLNPYRMENALKDTKLEIDNAMSRYPALVRWIYGFSSKIHQSLKKWKENRYVGWIFSPVFRQLSSGKTFDKALTSFFTSMKSSSTDIPRSNSSLPMPARLKRQFFQLARSYIEKQLALQMQAASRLLINLQLGQFVNANILVSHDDGISLNLPDEYVAIVHSALLNYFDEIDFRVRRDMLAAAIEHITDDTEDLLIATVMNAGPTMQKWLQLIGENARSEKLRVATMKLKSRIKPMPASEVESILNESFANASFSGEIISFEPIPIGAASVGQVHLAKWKDTEGNVRDVVLKVKRQGIEAKAEQEFRVFARIFDEAARNLGKAQINQLWDQIEHSIRGELDFQREFEMIAEGKIRYEQPDKRVFTPAAYLLTPPNDPKVIVMEQVPGVPIVEFQVTEESACVLGETFGEFAKIWFEHALFKSGFTHGDTHGGNLLFHFNETTPSNSRLSVIDFGNVQTFSDTLQERFIEFVISISTKDTNMLCRGLGYNETNAQKYDWETFKREADAIFNSGKDVTVQTQEILSASSVMGVELPDHLSEFARAKQFFSNIYDTLIDYHGQVFHNAGCPLKAPESAFIRATLSNINTACLFKIAKSAMNGNMLRSCRNMMGMGVVSVVSGLFKTFGGFLGKGTKTNNSGRGYLERSNFDEGDDKFLNDLMSNW